jgi:hypothetical protein
MSNNNELSFFRVKFYTQEIVFFRQDLLYRMRRSCLIPPTTEETSDPFEHVNQMSFTFFTVVSITSLKTLTDPSRFSW